MENDKIQIVCFNNPYPPNYGGVIDVYYKIKYLHRLNVEIYLHIYTDDRLDISNLKTLCKKVFVYKRNKSFFKFFSKTPFSVASRSSVQIYDNLQQNDALILFEGLQSTDVLRRHTFKNKIVVRTHNVEHLYYYGLSKSSKNPFKKLLYYIEGYKYERYQRILDVVDAILPLSNSEFAYFNQNFQTIVKMLPVFHGNEEILNLSKKGDYALYHGDLSIIDNLESAKFLASIFADLPYDFYIASSVLPDSLKLLINRYEHIHFQKLGSHESDLNKLIRNAHVNVLFSNQATGTKLKVFYALYNGRFCIVNKNIVDDKIILSLCELANTKSEIIDKVNQTFKDEFHSNKERIQILQEYLSINHAKNLMIFLSKVLNENHNLPPAS